MAKSNTSQIKVVTEYFEPYQIKQQNGQLGGFATEVVRAMFKETNTVPNITVMPWARAYAEATHSPNTLIYSIAHTAKRDDNFLWVGSLTKEKLYFWTVKNNEALLRNKQENFHNFRVAATRKSNAAQYLQDRQYNKIYLLNKDDQNILMLYKGRVDLIIATDLTVASRAEKFGLNINELVKVREIKELNNDLCIAFSKGTDPALLQQFRQAFRKVKRAGTLSRLQNKWLTQEQTLANLN